MKKHYSLEKLEKIFSISLLMLKLPNITHRYYTLSLSSLEHTIWPAVLPLSLEPNALSLMFGSAPDLRRSSVISTPVSSGRATAMWRGAIPKC